MRERWKEILDGYYEVSNFGRVRRAKPGPHTRVGRLVKIGSEKFNPYSMVTLSVKSKATTYYVHILVIEAFKGLCPPGKEVNHKDGNKRNPKLRNLEYLTRSQNAIHSRKLGLQVSICGEEHKNSKLTNKMVREIRASYVPYRVSMKKLALKFGVSRPTIENVIMRSGWRHIA